MTKETVSLKDKIVDIVSKAADGVDKKSLADSTVKGIQLEGALSKLLKEKILKMEVREGQKFYFVATENAEKEDPEEKNTTEGDATATAPGKKSSVKGKKEKPEAKISDDEGEKEKGSDKKGEGKRDMTRYKLDGDKTLLTKSGLVLAVVKKYVEKHKNISYTKLLEVFPIESLQRFGIVQEISKARQFTSGGRDRFFLKDDSVIRLADKKRVVVCNQITSQNLLPLLVLFRKLGFKITS